MDEVRAKVIDLDLNDILPNRFQPRIRFSEDAIIELSESIKEHGVIQPVVVRPIGDKYEIIAGERRYKASVLAGKDTIPAIVTNLNDKDSAEVALIENVQRRDLSAIEEAISYKKILDMGYLTQEQLAIKLGKSQSAVANKVRLLNLCDEVQEALMEDKISERHARSLLKLSTTEKQKLMLDKIIKDRLTVRKADEEIDKMNNYITEPIEEPKTNLNENAFSPFNPGFVDVEKIENQAQEINEEKAAVDFASLLSGPMATSVPSVPVETAPIEAGIQTVDPFASVAVSGQIAAPEVPIVSEIPTTPIINEVPSFEMPTTTPIIPMFDNIVTPTVAEVIPEPEVQPQIEVPSVEPVVPIPMVASVEPQAKELSLADLLAPQGQAVAVPVAPTVDPFSLTPEPVAPVPVMESVIPVPTVEQEEATLSFEAPSTAPVMPIMDQVIPSTPIVETALPSAFMNAEPVVEDTEPAGEENVLEQVPAVELARDVATGDEITNKPAEVRPIIITDYSKQYDPILPNVAQPVERIDFKQIINLIRDVNLTIEKCGYTLETEEFDLEDTYQVIFKINKN
jgi:ParB-like partition proteins